MKEMICIVCPRGCHLKIDENTLEAQGNTCPRGEEYAKNEIVSPMRTITGSVGISGGIHPRLAVRTNRAVPKSKMFEIMAALHACKVHAPVKHGDVIIENVFGTGANVIASRDM
jgi:CxxC motif-containing protein